VTQKEILKELTVAVIFILCYNQSTWQVFTVLS